jgi:hypothetical protein
MNLHEILERRHRELGGKPESIWHRWFAYADWSWIMFCTSLTLAVVAYSISVLLPVIYR